ncbi:MAG: RagB/SusD family nutrient uptake outer membrane protein [Bacteroidales bacterium]|nr:RagB/SusD family nutrient uptake outer membrane protein [Bacteroidales bacterium]
MKKILSSALIALAAVSLNSCSDFLQPKSEGSYSTDSYFTSDKQAIDAVDACYARFLEESFLGREIMWEEAVANDMVWGRTRSFPELATMSMTTSPSILVSVWNEIVKIIAKSNWTVSSLLKVQESRALTAIESRSLGEAYFCRALAHFYLAYRYGTAEQGVPFVKWEDFEGGYNNEIPTQNASVIDDYRMIIEDFDAAEQLVSRCEDYADSDFGRAHKAACAGYKAKVYTYWACWDKSQYANVITEVNKMESQYGRSISGVAFTDNFTSDYSKWRNTEYVWAIPSEGGPKGVYGGIEFGGVSLDNSLYGLFNCWGQFKPSLEIYEEMSKDNANLVDPALGNIRLTNSLREYGDVLTIWGQPDFRFYSNRDVEAGFILTKYVEPFLHGEGYYYLTIDGKEVQLKFDENTKWCYLPDGTPATDDQMNSKIWKVTADAVTLGYVGDNSNWPVSRLNFPIMRFADCILLRAEAYLATGNASAAANDINTIRARANVKPLSGNATWTDLYHERRVELAFEYSGHAFDCKRWAVSGDPEIKALALAELNTHPNARHYENRSFAGKYVGGKYVPNTDFTVGPYEDYQIPEPKWEDYKIVFPYNSEDLGKANGALKQNKGYN